jgi:rod shape-determining protein MreD
MLTLFFVLESTFVELLPAEAFNSDRILVPHFLLVIILFFTVYVNEKQGIIYSIVFGLLFDIVYTEIIGINLFMFPLTTYLVSKIMNVLQTNIVIVSLVSLIGIVFLELGVYEMNFLIHQTDMVFQSFLNDRLFPTLLLNLAFTIIIAHPLKKISEKQADYLKND